MRKELFYKPGVAWDRLLEGLEHLGSWARRQRRLARLKNRRTKSACHGQLDSLELLEIMCLRPRAVIYDIGAHVGEWTLLAKTVYPSAIIHAFEPASSNQAGYLEATSIHGDVTLHPVAVGDENVGRELHIPRQTDAASLRPLTATGKTTWDLAPDKTELVSVVRLDDFRRKQALPAPDVIKLDIQGCELDALRGAEQCLATAEWIICEVSFEVYYEGQSLCHEVMTWLGEKGWRIHAFGGGTVLGHPLRQADILFHNEALRR